MIKHKSIFFIVIFIFVSKICKSNDFFLFFLCNPLGTPENFIFIVQQYWSSAVFLQTTQEAQSVLARLQVDLVLRESVILIGRFEWFLLCSSMLSRMFEIRDLLSQDRSRGSVVERYFDRQNTSNITNKILINGPHSCGKTSLLFSLALSFAEDGKNVLFLSPRKFNKLPAFPEGKQRPLTNVLQKIRMVYLESSNELLKYLASVDMDQISNVDCIAIDDLDFYIHNGQKNEDLTTLARILAYAVEAYDFM